MTVEIEPKRLISRDDAVGEALRTVLEELPTRDTAPMPFADLASEHRRRTIQRRAGVVILAAAGALAFWSVGRLGDPFERGAPRSFGISAEDPSHFQQAVRPSNTPLSRPTQESAIVLPAVTTPPSSPTLGNKAAEVTARVRAGLRETALGPAAAPPAALGMSDCQALLRDGAYEAASTCYEAQGRGKGVSAELAWLEKARMERRVLHAPERALATLTQYSQQFATGALRPEASLTRLELLDELGHVDDALRLVDVVLVERLAPTREAELRAVKARLLARAGRCDEAEGALAEALRLGASAQYVTAVRERCAK